MEVVALPHFPDHPLHVALFTNLSNASFIRSQLLSGNTDFEYAFLDASVLISRNHVLTACFRALNDVRNHRLKTRNVHSEIVFALSPNNNIAESFRRFGISDDSRSVIAIKVAGVSDQVEDHLRASMQGELIPFTDDNLGALQDEARIRKIYRLDAPKKGESTSQREREAYVLGSMALKGS